MPQDKALQGMVHKLAQQDIAEENKNRLSSAMVKGFGAVREIEELLNADDSPAQKSSKLARAERLLQEALEEVVAIRKEEGS